MIMTLPLTIDVEFIEPASYVLHNAYKYVYLCDPIGEGSLKDSDPSPFCSTFIPNMRNIEIQMNNAISDSKNWKLANTEVTFDQESGHSRVYLHGNHIATIGENFVTITDGGYQSRTTKSRLNAILRS